MSQDTAVTKPASERGRIKGVHQAVVKWIANLSDTYYAYLLLLPTLITVGALAVWPLINTFEISLHSNSLVGFYGDFVGFENYVNILTGERDAVLPNPFFSLQNPLQSGLIVTFVFTFVSVVVEAFLGFGMALVLDQKFRGRRWIRAAFIIPWAFPIVIQGMIFYIMFTPGLGFATELTEWLPHLSRNALSDGPTALLVVIIADIWKQSAFVALIVLAGLQSIDRSLYSVAEVAGATPWQQFKLVTFPLVVPSLLIALLFRTIGAMRIYGQIEAVTSCAVVPSLSCMVVRSFDGGAYADAATIAFITASIIGTVVSIYLIKYREV
ncbi:carbohydrate ABC transporter permease [Haloarcula laminariae]|uniref:carbohydrate ABC transporter permease n=1 Tax=Haloarcula laminariae TaxID=2961577 RepID=UPI0021C8186C|nr:sugar ABC transporter permease [Halomicroarcula laminariae]